MLKYHRTSMLTSRAQTVVNTVNTVGVMGKGIAATFKARYPEMFTAYRKLCTEGQLQIGQLWLWQAPEQWVLNFPTKQHWRNPSKLSYIDAGLRKFVAEYERRGVREISFPRLGCGNGGLDWEKVRPLMESYLAPLPIPVFIHDFERDIGLPEHREGRPQVSFSRSFDVFVDHIKTAVAEQDGRFETVSNRTPFVARWPDGGELRIERSSSSGAVNIDDMYELWNLLLHGPVTRQKLPGTARQWAYYVFAILSALPYLRTVEIGRPNKTPSVAIELASGEPIATLPPASNQEQREFRWG
jgi:O-acetyl-ADP-ribose deacetylase (regulator of RNase III)